MFRAGNSSGCQAYGSNVWFYEGTFKNLPRADLRMSEIQGPDWQGENGYPGHMLNAWQPENINKTYVSTSS
ncbi:hypothetical protein TH25_09645 [Thalassospira profundimaris]|uniref:Uncharacterized protein n=1 Tax=Thalassospira profundimaris TaxID=502049 RepID=A0A367XC21_9PROT|nr:hypothetical protein TH25_09645 [Thalassospira profundimaris]